MYMFVRCEGLDSQTKQHTDFRALRVSRCPELYYLGSSQTLDWKLPESYQEGTRKRTKPAEPNRTP